MIIASNILTLIRGPMAFLFLFHNPMIRLATLITAMVTDSIDGYIARKWRATSRFGAIVDPIMDKFFVFFVLGVFIFEKTITPSQAIFMISRDLALVVFILYLVATNKLKNYKIKPAIAGKVFTALQFITLVFITLNYHVPAPVFYLFLGLGCVVLIELFYHSKSNATQKD